MFYRVEHNWGLCTLILSNDRGPSSKQVVDTILSLQDTCRVVFIMGNHEEMMRDAISGRGLYNQWLRSGGQATLDSYGGSLENVPPEHIRFVRGELG